MLVVNHIDGERFAVYCNTCRFLHLRWQLLDPCGSCK
jgi:hypothetical protein